MQRRREALDWAKQRLQAAGSETPALDAEVLLGFVLGAERVAVLAHPELVMSAEESARFAGLVGRRERGEPVAYLVGRKEFFGLELGVDGRVLIPRPETEKLVERALLHLVGDGAGSVVVDVGTGSGAIAIAIAQARPAAQVFATDTSAEALAVARMNASRLLGEGRVSFLHGSLMEGVSLPADVVCANLPYITTHEIPSLPVSVRDFEPWAALDGGADGLDAYRALMDSVSDRLAPSGVVLMECDPRQACPLLELGLQALPGASGEVVRDLAGDGRVVEVRR